MDKGKHLLHREVVVQGDPVQVHEKFIEQVWWEGGFPSWIALCCQTYQLEPAKDEAGTGAVRQVPTYLQEEIISAEKGKFVEYYVRRVVWLPLAYHRARTCSVH